MIHNLESSLFTHGLDLADDLAVEAFLEKLRCQCCIENNGHGIVCLGYITFCLRHIDQEVILCENDFISVKVEGQSALLVQRIHRCVSV